MTSLSKINLSRIFERESRCPEPSGTAIDNVSPRIQGAAPTDLRGSSGRRRLDIPVSSPALGRPSAVTSRRKSKKKKKKKSARIDEDDFLVSFYNDAENRNPNTSEDGGRRSMDRLAGTYPAISKASPLKKSRTRRSSLGRSGIKRSSSDFLLSSERRTDPPGTPSILARETKTIASVSPPLPVSAKRSPKENFPHRNVKLKATSDLAELRMETSPAQAQSTSTEQNKPAKTASVDTESAIVSRGIKSDPESALSVKVEKLMTYPLSGICKPPIRVLRSFFNIAVRVAEDELDRKFPSMNKNQLEFGIAYQKSSFENDQLYLKPAGFVSYESVILPAIAHQECLALKKWQAKVQRDAPQFKRLIEHLRLTVDECIVFAINAAYNSRQNRHDLARERLEAEESRSLAALEERIRTAEAAREERKKERERRKKELEEKRSTDMKRLFPRNKELWREIAMLMAEEAQLVKEERLWREADKQVSMEEEEARRKAKEASESEASIEQVPAIADIPTHELQAEVERLAVDSTISSKRIAIRLGRAKETVEESESLRKGIYDKYTKEHQFYGYQGVQNAKNLIKFLSQDD